MSLYEQWIKLAYNSTGQSEKKTWDIYMPLEQKIYENILENNITNVKGTVKELGQKHSMRLEFVCGFIDGINEACQQPTNMEELDEETFIDLNIDFDKLYKKMVEYKAEHLYNLPQWSKIYNEDKLKELFYEQKKAGTLVKEKSPGRNDPCPCNSGKKYKKCCGSN